MPFMIFLGCCFWSEQGTWSGPWWWYSCTAFTVWCCFLPHICTSL